MRRPLAPGVSLNRVRIAALPVVLWLTGLHAVLADGPRFARDRLYDIKHIRVALDVDIEKKHVDAQATLSMSALSSGTSVIFDAAGFNVGRVTVATGGGAPQEARHRSGNGTVEVILPAAAEPGTPLEVVMEYELSDPKDGLHFFAPGPDDPDAPYQVWSQGQSEQNHFWIPCFDHPNERQTTELIITCDQRFQAISNGRLLSKKAAGESGRTTYHWLQDQPHVIYLVTMVVGEFAVKEETWRGKSIQYFVPPSQADNIDRSFGDTIRMLDFFSEKIGVEYPWDKYAQVCCYQFGGGMENTSATTLGDGTLHDAKAHADSSSEGLVAHELAHQWFGDLLTCREWAHLWLNEGFATYFEALWNEHDQGPDDFAHNMLEKARAAIAGGKELPIVHRGYENPGQQFDSRAYPKGAWVVHMMRRRMGDETFWKVINHYVSSHRLGLVETGDLRRAAENVTGRSWERFFHDWTERPGHPLIDVALTWRETDGQAEITVKQTQKEDAWHFPLTIELWTDRAGGGEPEVARVTRDITGKDMTIVVPLKSRPVMMRVDPGNTILKELTERKDADLWARQLRDDPDPVGRIFAARALAKDKTDANRKLLAAALATEKFWGVQLEVGRSLGDMGGDIARDALLAGTKLPEARARRACVDGLGKFKGDAKVLPTLEKMVRDGEITYKVEAAAINALADTFPEKALPVLTAAMDRDSPRETIRSAALSAMGDVSDASVVPTLIEWSHISKQRDARTSAINSLGKVLGKIEVEPAVLEKATVTLVENVEKPSRRVRQAAARALGGLGRKAAPVLPRLEALASAELPETLKDAIKGAIDKIQKDEPGEKKLADLKKRVDELEKENKSLKEKLAAAEKTKDAASADATEAAPRPKKETAAATGGGVGAASAHP